MSSISGATTTLARAAENAARRAYAAGSRDGAREMRLKAARLAADRGCVCYILEEADAECSAVFTEWSSDDTRTLVDHDRRCPAALAEAIRRLPDGGEAPAAEPAGAGQLAGWGGGS